VVAIRVVLADDNRAVLTEITTELSSEFEVVGTTENGEETLKEVRRSEPDVLILDISMPILNGLQVAQVSTSAVAEPRSCF